MSRPRVALLNASFNEADTRRNFRRELAAELVEYDVKNNDLPPDFGFDGFVVTGSAAGVYEDEEWIDALLDWTADAIDQGLPALGICYGHQVLAAALGGTVEPMGEYELGYREVTRVGESQLLDGLPETYTVFTSHQDTVTDLPPDVRLIAENDYGIHGFERPGVYAVQSHPEYDRETARTTADGKRDALGDAEVERVLSEITAANYAAACETKQLFDNFIQIVEDTTVPTTAD